MVWARIKKEIEKDREVHGKKPLKDKSNNQPPSSDEKGVSKIGELELQRS